MKLLFKRILSLLSRKVVILLSTFLVFVSLSSPMFSQNYYNNDSVSVISDKGQQQYYYSIRAVVAGNEDYFYIGGEFSFLLERKLNLSTILSLYVTPTETKVLKRASKNVYLNLSETRFLAFLSLEKTFWFNNTLGLYAGAGAGWAWFSYAGSNRDENTLVVPVINTGLDIIFLGGNEAEQTGGIRFGYEFINLKSGKNHFGFIGFILRF